MAKSRYLVCVSEKEHSRTALFFACTKAKYSNSAVDMLYVIDPVDYNTIFSVADVIKEERRKDALQLFKELQEEASKWHDIKPSGIIRDGMISEEIIHQINDDPNIIMLIIGVADDGSSNKGNLITNLTTRLGNEYHIPLMIIPGNITKERIIELNSPRE